MFSPARCAILACLLIGGPLTALADPSIDKNFLEYTFFSLLQKSPQDAVANALRVATEDQGAIAREIHDRYLLVKDFKAQGGRLPDAFSDKTLNSVVDTAFGGDHRAFDAFLKAQGFSPNDYRSYLRDLAIDKYMTSMIASQKLAPSRADYIQTLEKKYAPTTPAPAAPTVPPAPAP